MSIIVFICYMGEADMAKTIHTTRMANEAALIPTVRMECVLEAAAGHHEASRGGRDLDKVSEALLGVYNYHEAVWRGLGLQNNFRHCRGCQEPQIFILIVCCHNESTDTFTTSKKRGHGF
jgi:hypothetical protein